MSKLTDSPSVLIVLMGSLGDVVRGLTVATGLRKEVPGARITWLVEPKCEEAVANLPAIDEVLVFDRNSPVRGFLALVRSLRRRRFDIVLDLQRHFKSGLFSKLSGAPRRVGFHRKEAKEFNWLFNNEHIPYAGLNVNKFDHYRRFLDYLGADTACAGPFLDGWAGSALPFVFSFPRAVGLVVGSSWESKDWPIGHYRELIDRILTLSDTGVVLIGDRGLSEAAAAISRGYEGARVENMAGKTSLLGLISVLRGCTACVGPDSGPGHIASAVGTPYIALFGPTSPARTAPAGKLTEVVSADVACAPCYRRQCPGLGQICMKSLDAEAVFDRLRRYLEGSGEKH